MRQQPAHLQLLVRRQPLQRGESAHPGFTNRRAGRERCPQLLDPPQLGLDAVLEGVPSGIIAELRFGCDRGHVEMRQDGEPIVLVLGALTIPVFIALAAQAQGAEGVFVKLGHGWRGL